MYYRTESGKPSRQNRDSKPDLAPEPLSSQMLRFQEGNVLQDRIWEPGRRNVDSKRDSTPPKWGFRASAGPRAPELPEAAVSIRTCITRPSAPILSKRLRLSSDRYKSCQMHKIQLTPIPLRRVDLSSDRHKSCQMREIPSAPILLKRLKLSSANPT